MSTWLALAVPLAAIGLTYVFCIRPMRRGHCHMGGSAKDQAAELKRREEIDQLRTEIAQARRDLPTHPSRTQAPSEDGYGSAPTRITGGTVDGPGLRQNRRNGT
ncbi:hypothetical protein [Kribbella catacumbae]|uniref:hypothetical protein n=1 Tax=Kribbella catacumbae TaxID=460086 RepID=UPI00036C0E76|nr:hypothetical protein [Kribbella catacumbae]